MQRRSFISLAAAAFAAASLPHAALAADFKEGTDYVKLAKPLADAEGKLVKVFSYDCPFCFRYDIGVDPKALPQIEKAGLKFEPRHLETKGKYGRCASEFFAMCILKDRKAGKGYESKDGLFKKAKDAVYFAYHRKSERWTKGEAVFIETLTKATGISADEFAKERKTAAVKALADSWKPTYDVAKIQGIPAYVVNGKWLVKTASIQSIDGFVALCAKLQKM
ncbi:MAG: thiol:disulfide interchange protein [Sutterellaceae bacterium]|nr:thiol:disulfide interchange protein [Sutterellaceae bacterium]MDD7442652.1 thiol:disulfide interchange protein [Sutterellaceae bacterium]MDY2868486.1 thiol:disulfide interchange protein [Mesosutterella sp.]